MSQQKLDGSQVFRSPVDKSWLCPTHGVRAICGMIESNLIEPLVNDTRILPGGNVWRVSDPTSSQIVCAT
jgi:hypothetical protein